MLARIMPMVDSCMRRTDSFTFWVILFCLIVGNIEKLFFSKFLKSHKKKTKKVLLCHV